MRMLIILEGPDGAGKSMLAEKLSQQTGYKIVHRSNPKTEEEKAQMMGMYLQDCINCKGLILDRCWYSELVYGPVMRDKSVMTYSQMYELEAKASKGGAIIIYCTGSKTTLWKRCNRRGEHYIKDRATFDKICEGYDDLLLKCPHHIPVVKYEYKDLS